MILSKLHKDDLREIANEWYISRVNKLKKANPMEQIILQQKDKKTHHTRLESMNSDVSG